MGQIRNEVTFWDLSFKEKTIVLSIFVAGIGIVISIIKYPSSFYLFAVMPLAYWLYTLKKKYDLRQLRNKQYEN